jgi:alginate O-acetyltransferase complex protein AlgI
MLFNSSEFLFYFFPFTLLVAQWLARKQQVQIQTVWLIIASALFYVWWNPRDAIIVTTSILTNYWFAKQIETAVERKAKHFLIAALTINLVALGFFKYGQFVVHNVANLTGLPLWLPEIKLPLGISFFTFLQIAYLVDAYRERVARTVDTPATSGSRRYGFLPYALFVMFFPHLIAGPLVSHNRLIPQFTRIVRGNLRLLLFASGLLIFCIGLAKKVIIADSLAPHATEMFNAAKDGKPIAMSVAWLGALAYTFQLYFDFSGYSDMAVGAARMLGFKLPANFASPYKSQSIIDFWRRWHMTLSAFLRNYLYIPLGGSRFGKLLQLRNLMLTMLLGGLWHGAGWTFILWGAMHGGLLVINHLWRNSPLAPLTQNWLGQKLSWALTFVAVLLAWVLFRAHDLNTALHVYRSMFDPTTAGATIKTVMLQNSFLDYFEAISGIGFTTLKTIANFGPAQGVVWIGIAAFIAFFLPSTNNLVGYCLLTMRARCPFVAKLIGSVLIFVVALLLFNSLARLNNVSEFLYFQF